MTTNIKEKITGRIVPIEGDTFSAMRACVVRNETLKRENIAGCWSLEMEFHLSEDEYKPALIKWGYLTE